MELWRVLFILCAVKFAAAQKYFGSHIGRLSEFHHSVSGDVFAVDSRTLFIKSFNYDGEGPAAFFYVGNSKAPSNQGGFRIRDEHGSNGVLKRYINKDITLTLPEGKTLKDIKWFSVYCDEFSVDFGHVVIPRNLEFPRPQKINGLSGIHAVHSDNIVIVDAQTLLIPNFSYDGTAPDAKFWVGIGNKPSPNGIKIPDENGKEMPLRRYDRKTIVLTLPNSLTVFDIGHFGVWCEAFTVDFGHVRIPEKVNVPPSLKMLGISPQSKLNCEVLHDELAFEIRWSVAGESIVVQLVAKLDDNEYMSFGVSPDTKSSVMIGSDVVVAWVNRLNGKGYAQDYFLDAKSQCSGNRGSCPDTRLKDNTNSIRLLNAAIVNDYSIVTYQRPLKAADPYDLPIFANQSQAIVWAIGPLNQRFEVSYHSQFLKKNKLIDFGRQPFWNCPIPDSETKPLISEAAESEEKRRVSSPQQNKRPVNTPTTTTAAPATRRPTTTTTTRQIATPKPASVSKRDAWQIPPIQCNEPDDGVFYAQMGPTGGKRGYPAITGHVGWGISWYINGLLIPEINVVRGKTYTFVVEGGNNFEQPANYHPFYITDDPIGGYEYKNEQERESVKVFAGIHKARNGKVTPTGVGRICNWTPDIKGPTADEYSSFGAYQRSLTLKCDEGEPGIITWTPDKNTPDTVYYQCFTHRYLGWKINVLDSCDLQAHASEREEVVVDFEAEPSIRHESKIVPSENFLKQHEKDLIKHHNMNGAPPKVIAEVQNNSEFNKLISEGIKTAEALEAALIKEKTNVLPKNVSNIGSHNEKNINSEHHALIDEKNVSENKQIAPRKPPLTPPQLISRPHFSSPQIPIYLRPPQSQQILPLYRPLKGQFPIPIQMGPPIHRRPIAIERRPPPPPPPHRIPPYLIPQSSMQINHYKKPSHLQPPQSQHQQQQQQHQQQQQQQHQSSIRNNFNKGKVPPPPPHSQKPILLLGEPTEIKTTYRKSSDVVVGKPSQTQIDLTSAFKTKKIQEQHLRPFNKVNSNKKIERVPIAKSPFKEPFNVKNDSSPLDDLAENTGFKEDTIVVESGFRPIFKREDVFNQDEISEESDDEHANTSKISRRSDNDFYDDDDNDNEDEEVHENQFHQSEPQTFEPVFIPSPEDSVAVAMPLVADDSDDKMTSGSSDLMAEASERQSVFYLPPNELKRSAVLDPLDQINLKDPLPSENYQKLSQKTKKFIQENPQFKPFRGELPYVLQGNHENLASSTVIKDKSPISTRLSAVVSNSNNEDS